MVQRKDFNTVYQKLVVSLGSLQKILLTKKEIFEARGREELYEEIEFAFIELQKMLDILVEDPRLVPALLLSQQNEMENYLVVRTAIPSNSSMPLLPLSERLSDIRRQLNNVIDKRTFDINPLQKSVHDLLYLLTLIKSSIPIPDEQMVAKRLEEIEINIQERISKVEEETETRLNSLALNIGVVEGANAVKQLSEFAADFENRAKKQKSTLIISASIGVAIVGALIFLYLCLPDNSLQ